MTNQMLSLFKDPSPLTGSVRSGNGGLKGLLTHMDAAKELRLLRGVAASCLG